MAGSRADRERRIAAFRALYRRHYGFVWQTMQRFGVLPALVDDAVQDAFIVAFRRLDDLVPSAATRWLYGIARRIASNYRRAQRRASWKQRVLAERAMSAEPTGAPQDAVLDLDAFLAALAPVDRELFVLTQLEGMTGPESAELLAINPSTAYDRIGRLRRRFCEHLGEREPRDVLLAARRKRPRASARGWAVLLPRLGLGGASWLARWTAIVSSPQLGWIAAPIVAVVLLGALPSREPSSPSASAPSSRHEAPEPAANAPEIPAPPSIASVPAAAVIASAEPRVSSGPAMPSRRRAPVPRPSADAPVAVDDGGRSLARHNQLLREAVDALRAGRVAASLAGIAQHEREFPESPLADARAALHVEALCASDREIEARAEATRLLRHNPRSPVRGRIERSCAAATVDPPRVGQEKDR